MNDSDIHPILLRANDANLENKLSEFGIRGSIDAFAEQAEELYEILNPGKAYSHSSEEVVRFISERYPDGIERSGTWAIYPWLSLAVHVIDHHDFRLVRTARNRLIITEEEQTRYAQAVIGIAGMSVGSSIAATIAMTGGAERLKIADRDTVSLSNLNRLQSGITSFGINKAVACARKIYEQNPYATVEVFAEGLDEANIDNFMGSDFPIDILFEEIDNLKIKIDLRLKARELKIPVIMITDNGDNIIVDIERFDQGVTSLFHGRITEQEATELFSTPVIDAPTKAKMALRIIGGENAVPRMQESLMQLGRSLASWPQLGTATTLTATVGAYLARRIALGYPVVSGRLHVSLDEQFIPEYNSLTSIENRKLATEKFVNMLSSL